MSDYKTQLKQGLTERLVAFRHYSHTVVPKDSRHRFLIASVAVSALVLVAMPKSESGIAEASVETPELAAIDLASFDMSTDLATELLNTKTVEFKLRSGDNLGPLLQKNGLSGGEAYRVTQAFASVYKPKNLRVGQTFQMHFTNDSLDHLTFKPNVESSVFVSRVGEDFKARKIDHSFKYETIGVAATINNSLYVDATKLGAPDKVVAQFANIYEYSVDFQRDIQPGDEFEMFFEVARDRKGKIIKAGDLLYTSFSPRGKQSEYYLFKDDKGRENFYDADGKTAKRKLRATPINGARLSSSYGKRRHPILGYRKMHTGVDFAAPRGTPILAAGSGTVERANRYGGYGNYILIRHTDGYKTAYAHLNKFARGVRAGAYVTQDQVIGYVGTTGRSTGPHLHYEVHHHGKKINPRSLSQLSGKPLSASAMPEFKARRAEIDKARRNSQTIRPAALVVENNTAATISSPTINTSPAN
ncbi:M23 family metallopeptidase [Litorimonas sp. RW-G-Af-16]|uniref:M23 family metallopeptidase n=1 Tax=Litorimonas sp. RW-G-Af-16 TaxID=3241168 RepID=UPI00390C8F6F